MAFLNGSLRLNTLKGQIAFLLFLLLFTTIPVVLLGVYTFRTTYDSLTNITLERRLALAKLGANSTKERLDRLVELGKLYASHEEIIEPITKGDWEKAINSLESHQLTPLVDRMFLADPLGIEKAAFPNDPSVIGQDFSFREWYKGVSQEWKPYISGLYQRAATPQINLVAIAIPIFSEEGEKVPVAILVFQVPASTFSDVTSISDIEGGFLYLVDKNANLIFHPDYKTDLEIVNLKNNPPVTKVLEGMSGYLQFYNDTEKDERLSSYWPVPGYGWGAVMTESASTAFAQRDMGVRSVVLVWSVMTAISIVLTFILFRFVVMLTQQRERERVTLESLGEGLLVVDPKGKIILVNSAAEKISGFTRQELIGQFAPVFFNLYKEPGIQVPLEERPLVKVMQTGKVQVFQFLLQRKSGELIPLLLTGSPLIFGEKLVGLVAVFSDISEQYKLDKAKDDFITTAAHQLNSPLGQIRWSLDLLIKKYAAKCPKPAQEILVDAHDSTVSLAALVNDLLIASRVAQDRIQDHPLVFDCVEAIKRIVKDLSSQIKENKVVCTVKTVGRVPELMLDQLAFRQVFENLIRNAIKYNKPKGRVEIVIEPLESQIQITITDTGIGIPKNDLDSLFGKFFRASNVEKTGISGTGLGLFVVKAYVERWGGKVEMESEEGKGTVVTVRIPVNTKLGGRNESDFIN